MYLEQKETRGDDSIVQAMVVDAAQGKLHANMKPKETSAFD